MDIRQKLYWLVQAGIFCFCDEKPHTQEEKAPTNIVPATAQAQTQATKATDLPALNHEKENCNLSSLKRTASHTVLGSGSTQPQLMCVLETPDSESDKAGLTITGAQGALLTKMMAAIGLDIQKDVYVTYLSPWRTPGNRPLTETEKNLFLPFLTREIQLIQPAHILLFGASVANALLNTDSLAKARGTWHTYQTIPTRVTLALSAITTTPARRQAWTDLQEIQKKFTSDSI